ncbi:MAG: nonstructural protein [Microvirus sp.]|nr:MAG: nonstructural protein [Microvirus sp.]
MKHIYAVKDLAVQAFGMPFFLRSKGEAMRSFQDEVNRTDGKSSVAQHPDDYELYNIGEYDDATGAITPMTPELVARAKDLLTPRS